MQCTNMCTAHVLPRTLHVLSCWAVLGLRRSSLFLHPYRFVLKLAFYFFFLRFSVHVQSEDVLVVARDIFESSSSSLFVCQI